MDHFVYKSQIPNGGNKRIKLFTRKNEWKRKPGRTSSLKIGNELQHNLGHCLSQCSSSGKRHHDHSISNKGKHLGRLADSFRG